MSHWDSRPSDKLKIDGKLKKSSMQVDAHSVSVGVSLSCPFTPSQSGNPPVQWVQKVDGGEGGESFGGTSSNGDRRTSTSHLSAAVDLS